MFRTASKLPRTRGCSILLVRRATNTSRSMPKPRGNDNHYRGGRAARNIDFQSVRPAEFHFADIAHPAGRMSAGRTGHRPMFPRTRQHGEKSVAFAFAVVTGFPRA